MAERETIRLDIPATHRYLSLVGACVGEVVAGVEDLSEREALTSAVQLAVHEACANIIQHAYASREDGRILVTFTADPAARTLRIELLDTGRAFDLAVVPEPNLEEPQEHGYGIFLIRQIMDEVAYDPAPGGNRWVLAKRLG